MLIFFHLFVLNYANLHIRCGICWGESSLILKGMMRLYTLYVLMRKRIFRYKFWYPNWYEYAKYLKRIPCDELNPNSLYCNLWNIFGSGLPITYTHPALMLHFKGIFRQIYDNLTRTLEFLSDKGIMVQFEPLLQKWGN